MLRDPEQPDKSWEDYDEELDPARPFYPQGKTRAEEDAYAQKRCAQIHRVAERRRDMTGGNYYFCRERRKKNDSV